MIKIICRLAAIFLLAAGVRAAGEGALRVEVSGLTGQSGKVYLAVYDNGDNWLGEQSFASAVVDIDKAMAGELLIATLQLPPGDYALSLFYDANGNGELDSNFIGIPKEPVAMSNNAKGRFGPPKYRDALFSLPAEGVTQRIEMVVIK